MLSKPVWSWLDAVVIGALLLAGTSAMVEARNTVVIDPPEAVDLADAAKVPPLAPAASPCALSTPTGEVFFAAYAEQAASAMAGVPLMSCAN